MKTKNPSGAARSHNSLWFNRLPDFLRSFEVVGLLLLLPFAARVQADGCTAVPAGLVGWWRGEGNVLDSAQMNHGSAVGGVTIGPGKVGNAFCFDGNGFIVVPHHASLNCSNAMTVELWYKSLQGNDHYYGIIDKRVRDVGANFGINVSPGAGLGLYYDDLEVHDGDDTASSFEACRYFPAPASGVFHHLAATFRQVSNNLVQLETYVDGKRVRQRDIAGNLAKTINTAPVTIGATAQGAGEFFRGVIDEISIYNRVLNAVEIQSIYAADAAGKCVRALANPSLMNSGTPWIASFSPKAGPVGSAISILGANFSPVSSNNIVYFGATRATVSAASATGLVVNVPCGAVYAPISVAVNGRTRLSPQPFLPTFTGAGKKISKTSFGPPQNLAAADGPIKSVIADIDGDGKTDLVQANAHAHNVSLFRSVSIPGTLDASSFAPRVDLPLIDSSDRPSCITVADVDGDGKLDIVVGDQGKRGVLVYRNISTPGELTVGSFAAPVSFTAGAGSDPQGVRVADLNGDGLPEILVVNRSANTVSILRNIGLAGTLTTNSFAPQYALATGGNLADVGVADLNDDGQPDLVTTACNGAQLSLLRNVAAPDVSVSNWFVLDAALPALPGSLAITVADMDGDEKSDLVVAATQGKALSIYHNQATGGAFTTNSFAPRVDYATPGWGHNIAVADFNGDAKPDLAVAGELNSYLAVFQNHSTPGHISLAAWVGLETGGNAWDVAAGDLDGDNKADIVFANADDDTLTFYRNHVALRAITNLTSSGCHDVSDAFTTDWNPNGVWAYGYSTNLDDSLILFSKSGNLGGNSYSGGNDFWWVDSMLSLPGILHNPTEQISVNPTATIMLNPDQIVMYPGINGEFGVIRFTAPADNSYLITVEFAGADILGATTDVHLLLNGRLQYRGIVDGFGPGSGPTIITNMYLHAGDHLDFSVGRGENQDYHNDSTAVAIRICEASNTWSGSRVSMSGGHLGWWRGENDGKDAVNGNDAVLQPGTGFHTGKVGRAFNFDGVNPVAQVADAPALNPTNALTLEAWVYIDDYAANNAEALFGKGGGDAERQYLVGVADISQSGKTNIPNTWVARVHLGVARECRCLDGMTVLEKQKWYHLAMTYDGSTLKLYVNGVLDRSEPLSGPIIRTGQPLIIGGSRSSPLSFKGRIDELSLYDRALSASEISASFAAGSMGKYLPVGGEHQSMPRH